MPTQYQQISFTLRADRTGGGGITVRALREWLDDLPPAVQDMNVQWCEDGVNYPQRASSVKVVTPEEIQ